MVLCLLSVLGGVWLYQDHQQVSALGTQVYKEFANDGMSAPEGVLDDPVFADLTPPNKPVSYGRYKPPEASAPLKPTPKPTPKKPSAAEMPVKKIPSALGQASPQQPSTRQPSSQSKPSQVAKQPSATASQPSSAVSQSASVPQTITPLSFTERLSSAQNLHVLLIGTDQPKLDAGRADVLIVVTLDDKHKQMSLLSIPRDTRIALAGHGLVKINAAYAYGGAGLQTAAVERFLGIPMDKIVEVSLAGFQDAIDAVGGVNVNPAFAFSLDGQSFVPGKIRLGGEQALAYSRMRHDDPEGDLGRNKRQQEVIRSLVAALGSLPSNDFVSVISTLKGSLQTNFSPSEVVKLRALRPYAVSTQRRIGLQGRNQKIAGVWYYLVSDQERRHLHLLLR